MRKEIEPYADGALSYASNPAGTIILMRSRFRAFEGELPPSPMLKIGLNIGRTSRLVRNSEAGNLHAAWPRNGITVNLPNDPATGCSDAVTMIGLAVDLEAFEPGAHPGMVSGPLAALAERVTVDTLAAQQLRALFFEADWHGCSTAYFEHGLDVLLRRLRVSLASLPQGQASPLDERRLSISLELIESQLSEDLTVRKMAQAVQMDPTNFAKKFRSATGLAPFAYLTGRRMERAKQLLLGKMSVTDAALSVGYSNPSKFAEAFRRKIGRSPAAWRQAILE